MYKTIFDILVDPLGLPLDYISEYLIMAVIDFAAYKIAFEKTGHLFRTGWIVRGEGKATHWTLRLLFFVCMWLMVRAVIWLRGFVIDNVGVSIFAGACIVAIIITIKVFNYIEEKKRIGF